MFSLIFFFLSSSLDEPIFIQVWIVFSFCQSLTCAPSLKLFMVYCKYAHKRKSHHILAHGRELYLLTECFFMILKYSCNQIQSACILSVFLTEANSKRRLIKSFCRDIVVMLVLNPHFNIHHFFNQHTKHVNSPHKHFRWPAVSLVCDRREHWVYHTKNYFKSDEVMYMYIYETYIHMPVLFLNTQVKMNLQLQT